MRKLNDTKCNLLRFLSVHRLHPRSITKITEMPFNNSSSRKNFQRACNARVAKAVQRSFQCLSEHSSSPKEKCGGSSGRLLTITIARAEESACGARNSWSDAKRGAAARLMLGGEHGSQRAASAGGELHHFGPRLLSSRGGLGNGLTPDFLDLQETVSAA